MLSSSANVFKTSDSSGVVLFCDNNANLIAISNELYQVISSPDSANIKNYEREINVLIKGGFLEEL